MQYIYCNTLTTIVRAPYTGEAKMYKNVLNGEFLKFLFELLGNG